MHYTIVSIDQDVLIYRNLRAIIVYGINEIPQAPGRPGTAANLKVACRGEELSVADLQEILGMGAEPYLDAVVSASICRVC